MPYYAYSSLKEEQKKMVRERGWTKGSQKVNRFLFRLVNRVQPNTIIEVGRPSSTALYLQSAKPSASYLFASDLSEPVSGCGYFSRFSVSERLPKSGLIGRSISGLRTPYYS